jgi:hypothetical protein
MSDRVAARDAALVPAQLLDDLVSETLASFVFPGGGEIGTLSHAVIHGLDMSVPLGLGSVAGARALRLVLDMLAIDGVARDFGANLDGRKFVATDLDWTFGAGDASEAPAHLLVLELAGRDVASLR